MATQQDEILLELQRSKAMRLRVSRSEFKGRVYIDVRQYYESEDGSWRPSSKGISLRIDELAEVARAISEAAPSAPESESR
jgi:Transcriptional Coactivator p15 (PC4)